MEGKKNTLRTLPFFGCLPSSSVYLEQEIVCLARSGPTQASDVTKVHAEGISHLGFNPQSEPCLHTHPVTTLILGCVLRKIYIWTYFKQVNVREQTYSCSSALKSLPVSCSSPIEGLPCFLCVSIEIKHATDSKGILGGNVTSNEADTKWIFFLIIVGEGGKGIKSRSDIAVESRSRNSLRERRGVSGSRDAT